MQLAGGSLTSADTFTESHLADLRVPLVEPVPGGRRSDALVPLELQQPTPAPGSTNGQLKVQSGSGIFGAFSGTRLSSGGPTAAATAEAGPAAASIVAVTPTPRRQPSSRLVTSFNGRRRGDSRASWASRGVAASGAAAAQRRRVLEKQHLQG